MGIAKLLGLGKSYKSKPKTTHPWRQAAHIATEEKRGTKRSEGEWRAGIIASRDRMGVRV